MVKMRQKECLSLFSNIQTYIIFVAGYLQNQQEIFKNLLDEKLERIQIAHALILRNIYFHYKDMRDSFGS
jgi:hypothetical protein